MFEIIDLPRFIIGTILIVLLPGPNSLYLLATASRYGIKRGYQAALGILTGDSILILATVLGAVSLIHAYPIIFTVLKVLGAGYLGYLGIKLFLHSIGIWKNAKNQVVVTEVTSTSEPPMIALRPFRTALTISLLNPKAILFFLSFFVQFVDPKSSAPMLSFLILAVILQFISFSYLTSLIFGGRKLARYFSQQQRLASLATCAVGILFLTFGAKLAFSTI
ncbi:leucine efflux protein LeuE [Acinetobacter sp. ANC 4635]|uniref:leucine efflux protein LeuE n=1 Tax=Acinetobacter sp. ANC 4635 TaxID=2529846 RepID=UPI00103BFFEE|nr:leucine efflux protein LeuE [Acinetobacter sp. ANC 4635]TCB30964.1 leucine efflux protein LeuE [Acinetobacter sp. ANC 4635]